MAEIKSLARQIAAAGGAGLAPDETEQFLYVEDSALVCRGFKSDAFDSTELITDDVRPDSVAVYLLPPEADPVVLCISASQSMLRALLYDPDMDEWDDDKVLPEKAYIVHTRGAAAGIIDESGQKHAVFQDASGNIVYLNDAWVDNPVSVQAAIGTPLCMTIVDKALTFFYISATDHCLHIASQLADNKWADSLLSGYVLKEEMPKRLIMAYAGQDQFSAFVLTDDRKFFELSNGGEKTELGSVDEAGEWLPATKEQCCYLLRAFIHYHIHYHFHCHRRRRIC